MEARGLAEPDVVDGDRRSSVDELAASAMEADKVLVFRLDWRGAGDGKETPWEPIRAPRRARSAGAIVPRQVYFPKTLPRPSSVTPIYLDYNASTPIDPAVAAIMRPLLVEAYGNPSSGHWASVAAKAALKTARRQVAGLLGCEADEVVFTSGGSEANNQALKGLFFARGGRPSHVITSRVEHPAILEPCRFLERLGATVTYVRVDASGLVDPDDVREAIGKDTFLISLMHANNEVGAIQPIAEVATIARERGIALHTDAAQSVGKIATKVDELGVDLLSVAGHKVYAPKGIGVLYVRRGIAIEPLIHGAGHERGRRAGTESALLAAALGKACEVAQSAIGMPETLRLRDLFWERLQANFGDRVVINGHPDSRLPNTLNVSFVGCVGADILARMPEVAASTGSACHSGEVASSPVLAAMGVAIEVGMGAIRFSLGRWTTRGEIEQVVDQLRRVVA
jgi:cysteine desulfurase